MDVILLMAMTVDGRIAKNDSQLVDWTGKEDKEYFVKITRESGVVIMGSKTYDTIGVPLPGRKNIVLTRDVGRLSDNKNLVFTDDPPEKIIEDLKKDGFTQVALIGGSVVNTLFAKSRLISEIHITMAPIVFGSGLSIFNEELDIEMELMEFKAISKNHLLLKYKFIN